MTRSIYELVPSFAAELKEIRENGISTELLQKIIDKNKLNSAYNQKLYWRYMAVYEGVDIFDRKQMYEEEDDPINNKVNNDFFGEIVDFKVGYFAGKPVGYGYSKTDEAEKVTGGKEAVERATKAITDFTTRNNMFGVDMEVTKFASIYGYAGRLFYIEEGTGDERVMPVHGYETIILSDTNISEPEYAIRYYKEQDINGIERWVVEFYDDKDIYTYRGELMSLVFEDQKAHLFDFCPLQGVANNKECLGDAEKVLALIDDYDKTVSDNSNESEAFAHALMLFSQNVDDETIKKAQKTGALVVPKVGMADGEPVKWLTKNINDGFTEHHLDRLEDNIYRFSKTPNLGDEAWGNSSGVSLKFKLHGLEVKCAQFQAQMMNSAQYMWKLLASSWGKKGIVVDPLQCTTSFERNFPLDHESNARTAQQLIAAGVPKSVAWDIAIPEIDDVDYVLEVAKQQQEDAMSLYQDAEDDEKKKKKKSEPQEGDDEEDFNDDNAEEDAE